MIPSHVAHNPKTEYRQWIVKFVTEELPLRSYIYDSDANEKALDDDDTVKVNVTNLGVKNFRRLLKKKRGREDFQVYQAVQVNKLLRFEKKKGRKGIFFESPKPKTKNNIEKVLVCFTGAVTGRPISGM